MKKLLAVCIFLLVTISLYACRPLDSKGIGKKVINNSKSVILYPYKITTDSGKSFKYGYINQDGRIIINPKYDCADFYHNGYYLIKMNNKWGMLDAKGNQVIKPIYQDLKNLSDGLISAELNGKYGYIDIDGNIVIPFQFDQADNFSEGKAYVFLGSNQFIDKKGRILAQKLNYICIDGFKNGYATILVNNKLGYIDDKLNIVIDPKYEIAGHFINGKTVVGESLQKFYQINKKGEKIYEFPKGYTFYRESDDEKLLLVDKNGKKGYMDMQGKLIISCNFNAADMFIGGYAIAVKNGNTCIIDYKGNTITDSLPKDYKNIAIVNNMVLYNSDKGTVYYSLTGKKVFSSIHK